MKKEAVLYSVIGLLVGLLIAGATATLSVNNDYRGMMRMMGMNMSRVQDSGMGHMDMSMSGMQAELQNKTGDEFDENFVAMMIAHHQGAIDMAEHALRNAKHDEVKQLAQDIVKAQSQEIDMMQDWQTEWDYDSKPDSHTMH